MSLKSGMRLQIRVEVFNSCIGSTEDSNTSIIVTPALCAWRPTGEQYGTLPGGQLYYLFERKLSSALKEHYAYEGGVFV